MELPPHVWLLSQRINVEAVPNLHCPDEGEPVGPDGEPHLHRAYGVYTEEDQTITLDDGMQFERMRETFLHENLHAMLAMSQLDTLMNGQAADGFDEHVVSVLAPVMLSWMRDNPAALAFLQEKQSA
jgi:hypothetical protein